MEVVGQVEIDPFCRAILAQHWPDVPRRWDLKKFQGDEFGPIDVCISSIPCVPHSLAGRRRGAGDERDLWPEMRRVLSNQRMLGILPKYFLLENVPGLLNSRSAGTVTVDSAGNETQEPGEKGSFFKEILEDLGELGYRIGWSVYGAHEIGAPHRRKRVFLVAYSCSERQRCFSATSGQSLGSEDYDSHRFGNGQDEHQSRSCTSPDAGEDGKQGSVADTDLFGCNEDNSDDDESRWQSWSALCSSTGGREDVAHAGASGPSQWGGLGGSARARTESYRYQWRSGLTQSGLGRAMFDGLSDVLDSAEWAARPGQVPYSWEPPRTVGRGVKWRVPRLKALGNTIVPQQLYPLLKAIVEVEKMREEGDFSVER